MMQPSDYGIKFVWDKWRQDTLRTQRVTFNTNNPVYFKYNIPIGSKMLVYVLGNVQQLQGMYEVTGPYKRSGDPRFDGEIPVNLVCDKTNGLSPIEIRRYVRSFNPSQEGISYLPLSKYQFDSLYNDLQNKI
jgi:hypothetical protein